MAGFDPMSLALGGLMGGLGGTRVSTSSTSSAVNTITFNPVVTALTGMGNPSSPTITASPSTSLSPSADSNASGGTSSSLPLGGLLGATTPAGVLSPGISPNAVNPNGVSLTTNSTTMMWLILGGGIALMMLTAPSHGGRR